MEESKKTSTTKKSSESSELKDDTVSENTFGAATFSSTSYNTTNITDPEVKTQSTSSFQSDLMTNTPTVDEKYVIMDRRNKPVRELGFQEKLSLPRDFKPEDVRLHVFNDGFTISCDNQQPESTNIQTSSYHQMKYTRMFDRPIRDVYMELSEGVMLVIGEFDDFDYVQ